MSDEGGIGTELSRGRRINKERDGAREEREGRGEKSEPCIQRGTGKAKGEGGQIYRQKGEKMENRRERRRDGYGEIEEMKGDVPGSGGETKFETINPA